SFLATWLEDRRSQLRPASWRRSEEYVRIHIVPYIGRVTLARLTPQHLTHLYDDRLRAGLSAASVHHLHATIHTALQQAVRWNQIPRNVADLVDPPRVRRPEMTALSHE